MRTSRALGSSRKLWILSHCYNRHWTHLTSYVNWPKRFDADFKMIVADLHSALGDAKLESGELKLKLAAALEQIISLQAQVKQRAAGQPTYTNEGVYSFEGEPGRFCTSCWDVGERRVRLSDVPYDFHFAGRWKCPNCNAHYGADV